MVKSIKTESVDTNAHKNNMRLDYIEGLVEALNNLSAADFECDSITAAIKKAYEAFFEVEDALAKISR